MWESAERHTQINWMMEQRKYKGEREGERRVIPHYSTQSR